MPRKIKTFMPRQEERYTVGVVGLGAVGKAAVHNLTNVNSIDRFYLFTPNEQDFVECKDHYGRGRPIDFMGRTPAQLPEELGNLDMVIVCADKSPYKTAPLTRDEVLKYNIELMKEIGTNLRGYEGNVIVVTNPVDINAYLLSSWSGMPPELITGQNHVDLSRWRTIIQDLFIENHLDPSLSDLLRVITIGPHNEEAVAIFQGLGLEDGDKMPKEKFVFLNSDKDYENLRKQLIRSAIRQRENGKTTEVRTSDSIREVVESIIYGTPQVCQSAFIEPGFLGIEGVLPGLFFGYPIKFDELGRTIPQFQIIDSMSDKIAIADSYHKLEGKILRLEQEGHLRQRVNKTFYPSAGGTPKPLVIPPTPDPISLDAKIIASADQSIYEFDNLKSPNKRTELKLKDRIESLELISYQGEKYLLVGKKAGFSILNSSYKEQEFFYCNPQDSVRRLSAADINDRKYVFAATSKEVFMFEIGKSKKPVRVIDGFKGNINNISVADKTLLVSADKVYQYDLDINPAPMVTPNAENFAKYGASDAHMVGFDIIASSGSKILKWNTGHPALTISSSDCSPEINGINSLIVTPYSGGTIFIAGHVKELYRMNLTNLFLDREYPFRKQGNMGGGSTQEMNMNGIGKIEYIQDGPNHYLLASDKTSMMSPINPGITIWNISAPESPRFFPIGAEHSIRGMAVVRNDP